MATSFIEINLYHIVVSRNAEKIAQSHAKNDTAASSCVHATRNRSEISIREVFSQ